MSLHTLSFRQQMIAIARKNLAKVVALTVFSAGVAQGQIVISGYLTNPQGADTPYEYIQLKATQSIDFTTQPHSVVISNNGTALSSGWIAGGALTYGINLTTGTVNQGDVFYVGGDGKLINGVNSTDISSLNWIRTYSTTTAGDGFGNVGGSIGNGGSNADGIAVFSGAAASLTASTVPLDALFFGSGVGTAKPATGGYTLPTNDFYNNAQGTFGNGTNTTTLPDAGTGGTFFRLTGTYNTNSNTWTTARTVAGVPLALNSLATAINSAITFDAGGGGPSGVTWTGATNNVWDTSIANWTPSLYTNGVNANFTSNLTTTITLTGELQPSSTIVSASSGTYTFSGNGTTNKISGGTLVKSGAGQLVLLSNNGFSSATINGGTISISTSNPLGNGNITFGGGTLLSTAAALSLPNNLNVIAGGGTIITGSDNLTFVGADVTGILTKSGSGELIIAGPFVGNAGGGINVTAGNLVLAQTAGAVNLYASGNLTGNLVLNGAVRLNFNGLSNLTGTGQIRVKASDSYLSTLSGNVGGSVSVPIVLNPDNAAPFLFTIGGTTGGSLTINNTISGTVDSLDFSNNPSTGGGRGTTILSAVHTYVGATTINHNICDNGSTANDSIRLLVNNPIPVTSHVTYGTKSGAGTPMINLNGFNQKIASLSDGANYSFGTKFLIVSNFGGVDSTFEIGNSEVSSPETTSAVVIVDGAKKVTLTKSGTSSQKLTGLSFHTGGTNVTGGTLTAEGSLTVANNVTITLDPMNPFVIDPVTRGLSNIDALLVVPGQAVDWNNDNITDAFVHQITNLGSIVLSANPPLATTTFNFKAGGSTLGSGPVTVANGATLVLAGSATAARNTNHITNAGTLDISGTNQVVGNIDGTTGTTNVTGTGTLLAPTLTANYIRQGALSIGMDATVVITTDPAAFPVVSAKTSVIGPPASGTSLTLGIGARLDLKNNDLIINNTNATTTLTTLNQVKAAIASAATPALDWSGPGITTSAATGAETLGYINNKDLFLGSLNSISLSANSVVVKYTYYGDADLDGDVDDDDFNLFSFGYGNNDPENPWLVGDFDYDGDTDDDDFNLFSFGYGSTPVLSGGGIQAIPEPSTWVLGTLVALGLGAAGIRKRRSK